MVRRIMPLTIEALVDFTPADVISLFFQEFHGRCMACLKAKIDPAEVVCCGCYRRARAYHESECCPD